MPPYPNYRSNLTSADVEVTPSRFVILGDIGPGSWIVFRGYQRVANDLWDEWWHGSERPVFSFLDGSARREKTGLLVNDRYSKHLIPIPDPNGTYWWPYRQ